METTGQEKVKEKFLPSKKFLNHGKHLPKTDSFCSKKTRIFSSRRAWRTLDEDFQKKSYVIARLTRCAICGVDQ